MRVMAHSTDLFVTFFGINVKKFDILTLGTSFGFSVEENRDFVSFHIFFI